MIVMITLKLRESIWRWGLSKYLTRSEEPRDAGLQTSISKILPHHIDLVPTCRMRQMLKKKGGAFFTRRGDGAHTGDGAVHHTRWGTRHHPIPVISLLGCCSRQVVLLKHVGVDLRQVWFPLVWVHRVHTTRRSPWLAVHLETGRISTYITQSSINK